MTHDAPENTVASPFDDKGGGLEEQIDRAQLEIISRMVSGNARPNDKGVLDVLTTARTALFIPADMQTAPYRTALTTVTSWTHKAVKDLG